MSGYNLWYGGMNNCRMAANNCCCGGGAGYGWPSPPSFWPGANVPAQDDCEGSNGSNGNSSAGNQVICPPCVKSGEVVYTAPTYDPATGNYVNSDGSIASYGSGYGQNCCCCCCPCPPTPDDDYDDDDDDDDDDDSDSDSDSDSDGCCYIMCKAKCCKKKKKSGSGTKKPTKPGHPGYPGYPGYPGGGGGAGGAGCCCCCCNPCPGAGKPPWKFITSGGNNNMAYFDEWSMESEAGVIASLGANASLENFLEACSNRP